MMNPNNRGAFVSLQAFRRVEHSITTGHAPSSQICLCLAIVCERSRLLVSKHVQCGVRSKLSRDRHASLLEKVILDPVLCQPLQYSLVLCCIITDAPPRSPINLPQMRPEDASWLQVSLSGRLWLWMCSSSHNCTRLSAQVTRYSTRSWLDVMIEQPLSASRSEHRLTC